MLGNPITHGFTYNQQSEPVGPTAGQTWRERSAGGLIVGEWEWSGSSWMGRSQESISASTSNIAATTNVTANGSIVLFGVSILTEINCRYYLATADGSNNWTVFFRRSFEQVGGGIGTGNIGTEFLTLNTGLADWREVNVSVIFNQSISSRILNALSFVRTGTPGNLSATLQIKHRRIR